MGLFSGRERGESGGGGWETSCAQDPRFNMSGSAYGMASAEEEITKAILERQKQLGLSDAEVNALTIETSFCKY